MRVFICCALLLMATSAGAYTAGEKVLGRFGNMDYWYPATISAVEGGQFALNYDDGSTETVAKSQLRPLVWKKNQQIECQFEADWQRAVMTGESAGSLTGLLEDGSTKSSPVAKCRTSYPPEDPEAAAAADAAAKSVTGTLSRKKKRIDETKVNCDKADEITAADQASYDQNPLGAIFDKADKMCTYVQRVYQKAKPAKALPAKSKFTGVSTDHIAAVAEAFWAGSDDAEYVKSFGGRIIGSGWMQLENSDEKGVPAARQLGVAHAISYKDVCYVVYGHLYQQNGNHPNRLLPPAWSGSEYRASDYSPPEKIDCKLAKSMK